MFLKIVAVLTSLASFSDVAMACDAETCATASEEFPYGGTMSSDLPFSETGLGSWTFSTDEIWRRSDSQSDRELLVDRASERGPVPNIQLGYECLDAARLGIKNEESKVPCGNGTGRTREVDWRVSIYKTGEGGKVFHHGLSLEISVVR